MQIDIHPDRRRSILIGAQVRDRVEAGRRKVEGTGVVQLEQHSVHRLAVQRRVAERVDEIRGSVLEYLIEEMRGLEARQQQVTGGASTAIQQPRTGYERDEKQPRNDGKSGSPRRFDRSCHQTAR